MDKLRTTYKAIGMPAMLIYTILPITTSFHKNIFQCINILFVIKFHVKRSNPLLTCVHLTPPDTTMHKINRFTFDASKSSETRTRLTHAFTYNRTTYVVFQKPEIYILLNSNLLNRPWSISGTWCVSHCPAINPPE